MEVGRGDAFPDSNPRGSQRCCDSIVGSAVSRARELSCGLDRRWPRSSLFATIFFSRS